ncbi:MAG: hypothetical protein PHS93_08630 [Candidatus Omnitrophica bacterium]|nr:hypothetical protein [Candidatus Omnitrophota bacterium]
MTMYAGKKPKWAREVDVDNYQDIFELTAAAAQSLHIVVGHSVTDPDGSKQIIVEAVSLETSALTLTNYAKFPAGSSIFMPKITTPTKYWKCASSDTAVVGDWYKEELTQCT